MLGAQAFWGIRLLRIPSCILTMLVVVSTVTTGNHYVVDVIGGIIVAVVAMYLADRAARGIVEHPIAPLRSSQP